MQKVSYWVSFSQNYTNILIEGDTHKHLILKSQTIDAAVICASNLQYHHCCDLSDRWMQIRFLPCGGLCGKLKLLTDCVRTVPIKSDDNTRSISSFWLRWHISNATPTAVFDNAICGLSRVCAPLLAVTCSLITIVFSLTSTPIDGNPYPSS